MRTRPHSRARRGRRAREPDPAAGAQALEVGQKSARLHAAAPGGKQVKLSELTAKGPVVLYTSSRPSRDMR